MDTQPDTEGELGETWPPAPKSSAAPDLRDASRLRRFQYVVTPLPFLCLAVLVPISTSANLQMSLWFFGSGVTPFGVYYHAAAVVVGITASMAARVAGLSKPVGAIYDLSVLLCFYGAMWLRLVSAFAPGWMPSALVFAQVAGTLAAMFATGLVVETVTALVFRRLLRRGKAAA